MLSVQTIIFAFLGGLAPALIWLFFWLREDKKHPEPRKNILLTFLFGMCVVPIAFIIQFLVNTLFFGVSDIKATAIAFPLVGAILFLIVSIIEEVGKCLACLFG